MSGLLNLKVPWEDVKEKLLEAEPLLTEEDLEYREGEEEKLLERLARKMERTPDHIKGWIESVAYTEGRAG